MARDVVDIGDLPQLEGIFTNIEGVVTDPSAVSFSIREPDGVITSYEFAVDIQLQRLSVGRYLVQWPVTKSGEHWYRFEGVGDIQAAGEKNFFARIKQVS